MRRLLKAMAIAAIAAPAMAQTPADTGFQALRVATNGPPYNVSWNGGPETNTWAELSGDTVGATCSVSIGVAEMVAPSSNGATQADHGISVAWEFTDGATDFVNVTWVIPDDFDDTEDMEVVLHWSSSMQSSNCFWRVHYLFRNVDEDTSAAEDGNDATLSASSATAEGLVQHTVTIGNATYAATDDILFLQIERFGTHPSDTLTDTAELHAVEIRYIIKAID